MSDENEAASQLGPIQLRLLPLLIGEKQTKRVFNRYRNCDEDTRISFMCFMVGFFPLFFLLCFTCGLRVKGTLRGNVNVYYAFQRTPRGMEEIAFDASVKCQA